MNLWSRIYWYFYQCFYCELCHPPSRGERVVHLSTCGFFHTIVGFKTQRQCWAVSDSDYSTAWMLVVEAKVSRGEWRPPIARCTLVLTHLCHQQRVEKLSTIIPRRRLAFCPKKQFRQRQHGNDSWNVADDKWRLLLWHWRSISSSGKDIICWGH